MKILISSSSFLPSVGGLEEITKMLAEDFEVKGHDVTVCTETFAPDDFPRQNYEIVRKPSRLELVRLIRKNDVHLQVGASFRFGWPHILLNNPLIIYHQYFVSSRNKVVRALKKALLRAARENICCSSALVAAVQEKAWSLGNPYDDKVFLAGPPSAERERDILFVGRISENKGVPVLLKSLQALKEDGIFPTTTIVGPDDGKMDYQAFASRLGLSENQFSFPGSKSVLEVAELMRRHRILVVPSVWREPFGIVALEGIASGCAVIGTDRGGLPEAIGPCGTCVPAGDEHALASALKTNLQGNSLPCRDEKVCEEHLRRHRREVIADRILDRLEINLQPKKV